MGDETTKFGESEPWLAEIQKKHLELWKQHPIHSCPHTDWEPSQQSNAGDVGACSDEAADNNYSGGLRSKKETIEEDLIELYSEYLSQTGTSDENFQIQIKKLLSTFQCDIPARIVANAVGCSTGHARRYRWDDDQQAVREKQWSKKQREHQAPPRLVRKVRDRDDGCCVRCKSTNQTVVHHINPAGQDGPAVLQNLAVLCKQCHTEAHDGAVNKGEVIHESVVEFWSWTNGYDGWKSERGRQSTLDRF